VPLRADIHYVTREALRWATSDKLSRTIRGDPIYALDNVSVTATPERCHAPAASGSGAATKACSGLSQSAEDPGNLVNHDGGAPGVGTWLGRGGTKTHID
jgi:hypothetical protein